MAQSDNPRPTPLMKVGEVAEYLNVSERTIRRRVSEGTIPYVRVGGVLRFPPEEIEDWVRDHHGNGGG